MLLFFPGFLPEDKELDGLSTDNPQVVLRQRKSSTTREIPLAVFIGIPLTVILVLIVAIVWCYFQTKKQRSQFGIKGVQQTGESPHKWHVVPRATDANAYVEHPLESKHCPESLENSSPVLDEPIIHRTSVDEIHSEKGYCENSNVREQSSESLSSDRRATAI